ncbi:ALKBH3, partial [Symbiodinium pilosum]
LLKPAQVQQSGPTKPFWGSLDRRGSILRYVPDFASSKSEDWLRRLQSLPFSQGRVKVFGKEYDEPRLTCYFGDKPYTYSGRTIKPMPWSRAPVLQDIRRQVEKVTGETFNSVLCNRYRNGNDTMGWHADNEPIYGMRPTIASVTFGAERDFDLREGAGHAGGDVGRIRVRLAHGSLLVMSGATQECWQHSLPRRKGLKEERINLTFRKIIVATELILEQCWTIRGSQRGAVDASHLCQLGINWETGFESSGLQWKSPLPGETERYLIASFPKDFKISYARLPDPTWRPLIVHNVSNPAAMAVDEQNRRLFVADPTASKVFWYKLKVLPSKFLVTDGVQRVAAENVVAKGLAVSQAGDLFIAGRLVASPPLTGHSAIYKKAADALEGTPTPLKRLWTAGDGSWIPVLLEDGSPATSEPMSPSTPEIYQPGPLAVDMFTLYWGNAIKGNASALARGPQTVPAPLPGGAAAPKSKAGAHALANNLQSVTGLAVTSSGIFYAGRPTRGRPGIFALRSKDSLDGCAADDSCVHRVAQVPNPVDMCWDGDATLFVADAGSGAVVSIPSSTASRHAVAKVADALGVHAISMLTVPSAAMKELWRWAEPNGSAALALGGASNAAAAVQSGALLGARVSHVISVGSYRNFKALTTMQLENDHADIQLQYFQMSDWLRPDERLDLRHDLAEPLQALQAAVQPAGSHGDRVVLLHCDQGHNRSPTLALAFFLCNGHTLREAYCRLLRVRMDVDPLPPYRRGLEKLEAELRGECSSVSEHDIFALHVTELMSLPNLHELAETCDMLMKHVFFVGEVLRLLFCFFLALGPPLPPPAPPAPPPGPAEALRSDDEEREAWRRELRTIRSAAVLCAKQEW